MQRQEAVRNSGERGREREWKGWERMISYMCFLSYHREINLFHRFPVHLISRSCAMDILSVRKHGTTSFDSVLLLFCERTRERFWRTLFDINHGFLPIPMGNISKACTNLVKALLLRIPFFKMNLDNKFH